MYMILVFFCYLTKKMYLLMTPKLTGFPILIWYDICGVGAHHYIETGDVYFLKVTIPQ